MKSSITRKAHSRLLRIHHIELNSLAFKAGLKPGDEIEMINGHSIGDMIDLQFYGADPDLDMGINRDGRKITIQLHNPEMTSLGIEPDVMEFGCCGNHCQFCFIDQNPKGLRPTLYLKDEDYRLSFMHGNYVTLTQVTEDELHRIAEQRLSPLYLSIHAVNAEIRKQMLGIRNDDRFLEKLQFLAEHQIEMHGQVVLCPGINDGDILDDTIRSLASFHPNLQTLAIVPVGLTKYRIGLPLLKSVTSETANQIIAQVKPYQKQFLEDFNHAFLYLADEFYLLANQSMPESEHYGEYWQIENGVGLTRSFLDDFSQDAKYFPKSLKKPSKFVVVTGLLAAPIIQEEIRPAFEKIKGLEITVLPVENKFYGASVTVSGLLTGQDILAAIQDKIEGDYHVLLPENCINQEGLFLDDMTPEKLQDALCQPVHVISGFGELWN